MVPAVRTILSTSSSILPAGCHNKHERNVFRMMVGQRHTKIYTPHCIITLLENA